MTVLTAEFTHFNFVIRLSKAKQSAFRLCTVFGYSRCSGCPLRPFEKCIPYSEAVLNRQKLHFLLLQQLLQRHCIMSRHLNQAGTRLAGVVFFPFGSLVR